jgi:hypothetical protein
MLKNQQIANDDLHQRYRWRTPLWSRINGAPSQRCDRVRIGPPNDNDIEETGVPGSLFGLN